MRLSKIFYILLTLFFTYDLYAQEKKEIQEQKTEKLQLGDQLPLAGLPQTWVQGIPITDWEKNHVYIFEFWATWCGPCIAEMPHLEALNEAIKKNKLAVHLIGVNVFDQVNTAQVKKFLQRQKVKLTYTIAIDEAKQANVKKYWLTPLEIEGIPHAISVKNGQIIWAGHPSKLNTLFITQMLKDDFKIGTQPAQLQQAETMKVEQEANAIKQLYISGDWEKAEKAAHIFLNNSAVEERYKIDLLSIPSQIALANKDYVKMNAYLRRQADTLPQSIENLMQVANYILACDDLALEKRDIALALMCVEKSIEIKPENPYLRAKKAIIHELRGEYKQALDAMKKAVELDKSNQLKLQISSEKVLTSGKSLLADVKKQIERNQQYALKNQQEKKEEYNFIPKIAQDVESQKILKFLSQFPMAQGKLPDNLFENQIVFFDLWEAPASGPLGAFVADRRPGRWLASKIKNTSAKLVILSVGNAGALAQNQAALKRPQFINEFPVCIVPWEDLYEQLLAPFKMGNHLPLAFAVRGGQVIWFGNPQDIPDWVCQKATLAEYNHQENMAKQIKFKEDQKAAWAAIRQAQQAKNVEERDQVLAPYLSFIKQNVGFYMMYQEIMMGLPYFQKDYATVGKICKETLDLYPQDNFVGERVFKLLSSNIELREINIGVIYQAILQMMESKKDRQGYVTACWIVIAEIAKEQNDLDLSLYAIEQAILNSEFYLQMKEIEKKYRNKGN